MRPRLSVIIPTYNSLHLRECLDSVAGQHRADVECIVVDDRSGQVWFASIEQTVAEYEFVTLVRNNERLGPRGNFLHCLTLGTGEYVKVLQHDDVLLEGALDVMIEALDREPSAVMATSPMQLIDVSGGLLPQEWQSAPIVDRDAIFNGRELVAWTIQVEENPIGAPAASIIRRTAIDETLLRFATDGVERAFDVAAWTAIAPQGDVVYIATPLSAFRLHKSSLSGQPDLGFFLAADWGTITERALELGILSPAELACSWSHYYPRVKDAYMSAMSAEHHLVDVLFDMAELATWAVGNGTVVCAVLCDGVTTEVVNTALCARSVADFAVIVDRSSSQNSARSGVRVIAADWQDGSQLAAALSGWPSAATVLLAAGETIICQSPMHARSSIAAATRFAKAADVACDSGFDTRVVGLGGPRVVAELDAETISITKYDTDVV